MSHAHAIQAAALANLRIAHRHLADAHNTLAVAIELARRAGITNEAIAAELRIGRQTLWDNYPRIRLPHDPKR